MTSKGTLFFGLGSSHGDDRIGLTVAEQVAAYDIPDVQVHLARTPAAILDWLTDVERLVVCDACQNVIGESELKWNSGATGYASALAAPSSALAEPVAPNFKTRSQSESRPIGTLHRWEWPAEEIENIRFAGSHDLSLPAVLTLADRLGRRPKEVIILGVEIGKIEPGEMMSRELQSAIPTILMHVRGVLENA